MNPTSVFALQAGAKGYLSKGSLPAKIHQAIHRVMLGKIYLEPSVAQNLALKPFPKDPLQALSEREQAVFKQIAQGMDPAIVAQQLGINFNWRSGSMWMMLFIHYLQSIILP